METTAHAHSSNPDHAVPAPVPTPAELKTQAAFQAQPQHAAPEANTLRQRVHRLAGSIENASEHPTVQKTRGVVRQYLTRLREYLGTSATITRLERQTGVDRVVLLVGTVFLYIVLIPFNLFGLALLTTQLLTFLPAAYLSAQILDSQNSDRQQEQVKTLLSFFVVLGSLQTLESLMAGLLERKIPQYYTTKLLFLAYLLHPKTRGAQKIHENIFRPLINDPRSPIAVDKVYPTSEPTAGKSMASGSEYPNIDGIASSVSQKSFASPKSNNPFVPSAQQSTQSAQPSQSTSYESRADTHSTANTATREENVGTASTLGEEFPPPRVQAQQALAHAPERGITPPPELPSKGANSSIVGSAY
nr:hypothetical protein L203_04586 [Cryptococcus depauperatus CBS 7841]